MKDAFERTRLFFAPCPNFSRPRKTGKQATAAGDNDNTKREGRKLAVLGKRGREEDFEGVRKLGAAGDFRSVKSVEDKVQVESILTSGVGILEKVERVRFFAKRKKSGSGGIFGA